MAGDVEQAFRTATARHCVGERNDTNAMQSHRTWRALVIGGATAVSSGLCEQLQDAGINLTVAADWRDGWQLLHTAGPFSLVFLELDPRQIAGAEILKRARRDLTFATTRFVAITSHADWRFLARAIRDGADDHLQFPCEASAVQVLLRRHGVVLK